MRCRQGLILIGVGCALAFPATVQAADVFPVKAGSPCHVRVVGEISPGDAKRIEDAFNSGVDGCVANLEKRQGRTDLR